MAEKRFKKIVRAVLLRLLVYSVLLITVPLALGYVFMEKMLLPEVKSSECSGNIRLISGNADLDVFFYPPQPGKPVILYSHGNAETLASIQPLCREFIRQGYGVLAYDYAGYGFSGGRASEKQVYCDVQSVYRFLTVTKSVLPADIIVMGFSVGSGASCFIAEKNPGIKALVLIAPFASAIEVMLPFPLPGNRFNNAQRLKNCIVPVLIMHGTADRVIPIRNSWILYRNSAAGQKKLITVENAGHNDIFDFMGHGFYKKLQDFISF